MKATVAIARPTRKDKDNIQAQYNWAVNVTNLGMNFLGSCVFIDESGSHIIIIRDDIWISEGEILMVEVEKTRTMSHVILGVISVYAAVSVSVRVPSVTSTLNLFL
jgi:hypothetical protein